MKNTKEVQIASSWADVSLAQLEALENIGEVGSNDEHSVKLLVILSNLSESECWELPYDAFLGLLQKLDFLRHPVPKMIPAPAMVIGGRKFKVTTAISDISAGQFIDYKNTIRREDKSKLLARIVACFVVPDGKTYGDGYDYESNVQFLHEHLSVVEGRGLSDFFMMQSVTYIRHSLNCLSKKMRKASKKKMTPEQKMSALAEMDKALKQARAVLDSVLAGGNSYS